MHSQIQNSLKMTKLKVSKIVNIRSYLGIDHTALNQLKFLITEAITKIASIITYHR
jgi:hypothetical protein